ncbi:unnamed protein product [Prorocentrum cordatum]|uniref:Endonuclease/exonuclease/phosphatase domain-containing protein n=1 Tax=Prorocentrum cordatum TaxID=2364126 RepID=A0ABN9WFE9_9DINO|nr:unnamed protein product [Polarella glacialis]
MPDRTAALAEFRRRLSKGKDDTSKRLAEMEKLIRSFCSKGEPPPAASPTVAPWAQGSKPSSDMGPLLESDDEKVKREKLTALLGQYETVLKSLPGPDADPIRAATIEKIKSIREQQKALRTPAIAHRRTAQDLHKARLARAKMEAEIAEKTSQVQKLQESIYERRLQLEAKKLEIDKLDEEYKRTAALIAQSDGEPKPSDPFKLEIKPEETQDPDVQAFLGSDKWEILKPIILAKIGRPSQGGPDHPPDAAEPPGGDVAAGDDDIDMGQLNGDDFEARAEAFRAAAEALRAAEGAEAQADAKRQLLQAQAVDGQLECMELFPGLLGWLRVRGYHGAFGRAKSTGQLATESSGGVLTAVASHIAFAGLSLKHLGVQSGYFSRLKLIRANFAFPHGLLLGSVHGFVDASDKVFTWDMLEDLGVFLRRSRSPWILAGDFNLPPEDIKLCKWVELLKGTIVAPSGPTCFASKSGSTIDYYIVSQGLANFVSDVRAVYGTPSSPHVAVAMLLKGPTLNIPLHVRRTWKPLPTSQRTGPVREPAEHCWSWPAGEPAGVRLEDAWCQWLSNMELELRNQFDIVGAGQRGSVGRADGFERRQVPLAVSMEKAEFSGSGAQMRAWRSLDAILSRFQALQDDTVGASEEAVVQPSSTGSSGACAWREEHTGEWPAAPSVAGLSTEGPSLSLSSMGFILPDYTSPHSGPTPLAGAEELDYLDLSLLTGGKSVDFDLHSLRRVAEAGGEDLATLATNVHQAALEASQAAAKVQLQEWREWAQSAVKAGGRRAHRYLKDLPQVKGPVAPEGWALQGDAAAQAMHMDWLQYWGDAKESTSQIQAAVAQREELPRSEKCQVFWIRRPEDGLLSGKLFTDGSAIFPSDPLLGRAGWAVISVDDTGAMISGAFGPVPWDVAPLQLAKDGEDYAYQMLGQIALDPEGVPMGRGPLLARFGLTVDSLPYWELQDEESV